MKNFDMNLFSWRIRQLRLNHGLSQGQLAKLVDVSSAYISMIERGTKAPSYILFKKMAALFDVDEKWLGGNAQTELDERLSQSNPQNLKNQFDGRSIKINGPLSNNDVDEALVLSLLLRLVKKYEAIEAFTNIERGRLEEIICNPETEIKADESAAIIQCAKDVLEDRSIFLGLPELETRIINSLDFVKQVALLREAEFGEKGVKAFFGENYPVKTIEYTAEQMRLLGIVANYYVVDEMGEKWRVIYLSETAVALMNTNGAGTKKWIEKVLQMLQKEDDDADNLVLYATERKTWAQIEIATGALPATIRSKYKVIYMLYDDRNGKDPGCWWQV